MLLMILKAAAWVLLGLFVIFGILALTICYVGAYLEKFEETD